MVIKIGNLTDNRSKINRKFEGILLEEYARQ